MPNGDYEEALAIDWAHTLMAKKGNGMRERVNGMNDDDLRQLDDWRRDIIENPKHYTVGGYEAIDVIKAKLTPEEYRGACKANILKYLMRANYKGHHNQDCEKALYYMKELVNALDSKEVNQTPVHWTDAKQVREEDSNEPPF